MKGRLFIAVMILFVILCAPNMRGEDYNNMCFDKYIFEDGSKSFYLVDTIQIPNPVVVEVEPHYIYFICTMETLLNYDGRGEDYFLQQDNAYLLNDYFTNPYNSRSFESQERKKAVELCLVNFLKLYENLFYMEKPIALENTNNIFAIYEIKPKIDKFLLYLVRGGLYNDRNNIFSCPIPPEVFKPSEKLDTKYYYKSVSVILEPWDDSE